MKPIRPRLRTEMLKRERKARKAEGGYPANQCIGSRPETGLQCK
jgi:hypothetical protein